MEKDIKIKNIDIVQINQGNTVVFQLKDPKVVNRTILSEIRQEMSYPAKDSSVIYPDQRIIESNQIFIEDSSKLI
ncbi:MAG: hypothetical protein GX154_00885 [Clostridiales bacterium]|jgi:hypothetical protein|nr:hypothetical protein [Bacteroidales bacterium]NLN47664.1 hypothetical protein [Clostridiales bacterium]